MSIVLPQVIRCSLNVNNKPVCGVLIKATLETSLKNNYSFVFGPTSCNGIAEITEEQIRSEAEQEFGLAMMDFEPLESVFTGVVILRCMSKDEIDRALKAYELYKNDSIFPSGYVKMLKNATPVMNGLRVLRKAYVHTEPDIIKVFIR